jgi:hypothetical protein
MQKIFFFIVLVLLLATGSCRVVEHTTRTTNVVDSVRNVSDGYTSKEDISFVYIHDSIVVHRSDTVLVERFKDRFIYRQKADTIFRTDTILQVKIQTDTIQTVIRPAAEKQKSTGWKFWTGLGIGVFVGFAILIFALIRILRRGYSN